MEWAIGAVPISSLPPAHGGFGGYVAASSLAPIGTAQAAGLFADHRSITLDNGFRAHCVSNNSGYVAATCILAQQGNLSHWPRAHLRAYLVLGRCRNDVGR